MNRRADLALGDRIAADLVGADLDDERELVGGDQVALERDGELDVVAGRGIVGPVHGRAVDERDVADPRTVDVRGRASTGNHKTDQT